MLYILTFCVVFFFLFFQKHIICLLFILVFVFYTLLYIFGSFYCPFLFFPSFYHTLLVLCLSLISPHADPGSSLPGSVAVAGYRVSRTLWWNYQVEGEVPGGRRQ